VDRINKLLALARDGGATEAEAELAMAKAQELMAEYNLSAATLEAKGGAKENRVKQREDQNLMYAWKRELLEQVAKVNFCHVFIVEKRTRAGQKIGGGYQIIGRESNTVATRVMFNYLLATIEKMLVSEIGTSPQDRYSRWGHSFRIGCADRLRERLQERFDAKLEEQAKAAREANARSQHPGAAPTGNALVVVLKDFAQDEADLNNDMINGWEPGTTARRRKEHEERTRKNQKEYERKLAQAKTDHPDATPDVQRYIASGWSRDRAEEILGVGKYYKEPKPETERQRQKREQQWERYQQRERDKQWRQDRKTDWGAYDKGQTRANDVGLDDQVTNTDKGRIRGN
jgi:hypothetical protein